MTDTNSKAVLCVENNSNLGTENNYLLVEERLSNNDCHGRALSDHNYHCFSFEKTLQMNINKNPNLYSCSYCSKSFNNQANLLRHLRIHTGERPFQCLICNKSFSQQSNLWKHVKIHSGIKPFECEYCKKTFSQRANMQKHMIIHFGVKPFQCCVCEKAFTQQANLDKHMLLHTGEKPFECIYCPKKFAQRINMIKHQNFHLGLKPYACQICGNAFTQQSNLKKHLQVHTHSKRFVCSNCGKGYVQKSSLIKHFTYCPQLKNIKTEEDEIFCYDDSENGMQSQEKVDDEGTEVAIKCGSCQNEFADEESFMEHLETCQNEVVKHTSNVQINQAKCIEVLLDEGTNSKFIVLDNNLILKVEKPQNNNININSLPVGAFETKLS